jgi:hypothetical protein
MSSAHQPPPPQKKKKKKNVSFFPLILSEKPFLHFSLEAASFMQL